MTDCLLELMEMVYRGQGRSRLKSVSDVTKAPFTCSVCSERFTQADPLMEHIIKMHPDNVGPNMKVILDRYKNLNDIN